MDEKWLVCVTAGKWQYKSIQEAKNANYKILAIDSNPQAVALSLADISIVSPFKDSLKICKEIEGYSINICGAICFASEAGMILVSEIVKYFSLKGMDKLLTQKFIDKSVQRKVWKDQGVENLEFKIFEDLTLASNYIAESEIDLIIKPTISSGSRGVKKITAGIQKNLKLHLENAFNFSKSNKIIVEKYIYGNEFIIEVFFNQGILNILAILQKSKVPNTDNTVASELFTPKLSKELYAKIFKKITHAYNSLQYLNGPGHAEIIIDETENIHLVEVAARGGGFLVFDTFVPRISNINLPLISIQASCNEHVKELDIKEKYGFLYFIPSEEGILKNFHGFNEINEIVGVEAAFFGKINKKYSSPTTDGDRIGYIMVIHNDYDYGKSVLERCKSIVKIDYIHENY